MKLGLIARRDNTGLGYQTRAYYKHLKPEKTLVIDLSPLNGNSQNINWYLNQPVVLGIPKAKDIIRFLDGLDVVLTAETPYNYELYNIAKKMNVKVANVINWEFFDHYVKPELPHPDLIIMPSNWYLEDAQKFGAMNNIKVVQLHHPVDREEIPFRLRATTKPFHIAGKPAAHDRNGTLDFLNAYPDGKVITQDENYAHQLRRQFRHSNIITGVQDYKQLYDYGDILVFPRRYGGNCLPLNEALASGCPVIMPDIPPNNNLLPKEWLVPATTNESFTPRMKIDIYQTDIRLLADKIDWMRKQDIKVLSQTANEIADTISWEHMQNKWIDTLASLVS